MGNFDLDFKICCKAEIQNCISECKKSLTAQFSFTWQ